MKTFRGRPPLGKRRIAGNAQRRGRRLVHYAGVAGTETGRGRRAATPLEGRDHGDITTLAYIYPHRQALRIMRAGDCSTASRRRRPWADSETSKQGAWQPT